MGAGAWMRQECADLIGGFGREDVLELARLLFDLAFAVHSQTVGEQALGQAMPPDNASGTLAPSRCEFDNEAAVPYRRGHRLQRLVARIHEWFVIMRFGGVG